MEIIFKAEFEDRLKQYGIKEAFVHNMEVHSKMHNIDVDGLCKVLESVSCWIVFVSHAFFWQDTPEGIDYWRAVSQIDYIRNNANHNT